MKNLLMFVLSFSLITSAQITFASNGEKDVCCNKTEVNLKNFDPANDTGLNILLSESGNKDTSDKTESRKVENILPLYDLSLSNFAVEAKTSETKSLRIVTEIQPLYDLSIANFSVEKANDLIGKTRVVELGNPLYDLSMSHFAVKQQTTLDITSIIGE